MKICFITGSRAEYGLLRTIMKKLQNEENIDLRLIVTGMHLSNLFGNTYEEIINDGFTIHKIEMNLENDSSQSIVKSMGEELIQFSKIFENLKPDIIAILGDRYEILVAACAATIFNIPIIHFCGGDITQGAYDENIRHAITKMSNFHFVTNENSRKRIIQMGEFPNNVYMFGNSGLEDIIDLQDIDNFKNIYNINKKNLLILYHPVTKENSEENKKNIENILNAVYKFISLDTNLYFIGCNSDNNNKIIMSKIRDFIKTNINSFLYISLQRKHFLNLLKNCDMIIGNSSSGIYEAPLLQIPTINIGIRQDGRLMGNSIINCSNNTNDIIEAIKKCFTIDKTKISSPYPVGNVDNIINIIKNIDVRKYHKKKFYDINIQC